jgi:hypothetical protein
MDPWYEWLAAAVMVAGIATEMIALVGTRWWPLHVMFRLKAWGAIAFVVGGIALGIARNLEP